MSSFLPALCFPLVVQVGEICKSKCDYHLDACICPLNFIANSVKIYSDLCLSDSPDALQQRYCFMKEQRKLAYQRLKEAQELISYMDEKVQHYEDLQIKPELIHFA